MSRLLHVGDCHLRTWENTDDTLQALAQVRDIASRERVDAILIPGDVYDGQTTPHDRALMAEWLDSLYPTPVVICKGNHDRPEDLRPLALAKHVTVYETPGLVAFPDFDLAVFPWPERAHLAARGFTGEGGLQTAQQALGDLIRGLCASRPVQDRPLALMGHLSVCGAVTSSGQPLVGREIQVVAQDLYDTGAWPICLNHVHKPQPLYAGSLTCQDFGEEGEGKSVVLVDLPNRGIGTMERIPISGRKWITVEAKIEAGNPRESYDQGGTYWDMIERVDDFPAACVRYRYTCEESDARLFDHAALQERFRSAHSLKIVPNITRTQRVRSAEVAEARSVADKVRAWGAATETGITDGMLHKLEQIGGRP